MGIYPIALLVGRLDYPDRYPPRALAKGMSILGEMPPTNNLTERITNATANGKTTKEDRPAETPTYNEHWPALLMMN